MRICSGVFPVQPLFTRAPLRRCSCARRTAGFCFFRPPSPKRVWVPFRKMQPLPWEQRASRPPGCVPRANGAETEKQHVLEQSYSHRLSRQGRGEASHQERHPLHGPLTGDQGFLEGSRRRMAVAHRMAPLHRLGRQVRGLRGGHQEGRAPSGGRRAAEPRVREGRR